MDARKKPAATAPKPAAPARSDGRFRKGQSGNPGGRPKLIGHVRELARAQTEKSIRKLVQILDDKKAPHAAQVAAARELLDRGWGKPALPIGGTDDLPPVRSTRELSEAELMALAAQQVGGDSDG